MRTNPVGQYRPRIGNLRVYSEVVEGPEAKVVVKAVCIKIRERVVVGGKELTL